MNFKKLKAIPKVLLHKGQMFIPLIFVSSFFLVGYAAIDREVPIIKDEYVVLEYGDKFDVSLINIEDNRATYEELNIECDTSSLKEDSVGSSYVTVYATDLHNNVAQAVIEVRVEDYTAPNFEVADNKNVKFESGVLMVDYNSGSDITEYIRAYDNADGDVSLFINDESGFDSRNLDLSNVTLSVSDASGNINRKTFNVMVRDFSAPTISFKYGEEVGIDFGSNFNVFDFVDVTDNSDEEINVQLHNEVNTMLLGEVQVIGISATDASGNVSTSEIKVTVGDMSAPIINASDITIEKGDSLDIRSRISVIDNKDGDLTNEASIEGEFNTGVAGDYYITIRIVDSTGNEATKTIVVTVEEPAAGGTAVVNALSLVGSAYVYGGTGPYGFDCSGLTSYVYRQSGISIPRTTYAQYASGTKVSDIQPGDLLFYNTVGYLGHVGIYIGNGQMIHAGDESTGVQVANINSSYWSSIYAGAVRY